LPKLTIPARPRVCDDDIRLQSIDDALGHIVVDDDHGVHDGERGDDFRAFVLGCHGPRRAFGGARQAVRVDSNQEQIALRPGRRQAADVSGMQQIEGAGRECHAVPAGVRFNDERGRAIEREDHGSCEAIETWPSNVHRCRGR